MALPGSGTITWAMIRDEFGGGNPIGMNQYYRGGTLVPNTPANANVPTSGTIYASQFYNATKQTPLDAFIPGIAVYNLANGTRSASTTVQPSGGTGSYSVTNAVLLSGTGTISRSGLTITVQNTGTNIQRSGSVRVTITDGQSTITRDFSFVMQFGTPV